LESSYACGDSYSALEVLSPNRQKRTRDRPQAAANKSVIVIAVAMYGAIVAVIATVRVNATETTPTVAKDVLQNSGAPLRSAVTRQRLRSSGMIVRNATRTNIVASHNAPLRPQQPHRPRRHHRNLQVLSPKGRKRVVVRRVVTAEAASAVDVDAEVVAVADATITAQQVTSSKLTRVNALKAQARLVTETRISSLLLLHPLRRATVEIRVLNRSRPSSHINLQSTTVLPRAALHRRKP
jgi:hypothetical protein